MQLRLSVMLALVVLPGYCADWNPRLAAQYLDSRQEKWFSWPTANASGTPCISCHTGTTYLLVRPMLRRALGESQRTTFETGLLNSLRTRVSRKTPKELFPKSKDGYAAEAAGVESIFAALFLATENSQAALSPEAEQAFDRLWSLAIRDGSAKGAWPWFSLELDPYEMPESSYYGASLAALAIGSAPREYRERPDVRERVAALTGYLQRELPSQPLQNRLMALWASSRLPEALPPAIRKALIDAAWRHQQPDGSWTIDSLGAWKEHPQAPKSAGNSNYATGLTAYVLETAGVPRSDARLKRALDWLRRRQDPKEGYWDGESMNKAYPADSMMVLFMRDAATSFASMALLARDNQ
ncbi:MAG TPA: hypothetical protein VGH38_33550 [Bryobacteraceae bacterium]|jgi:squalene-hopene/tetraprenyl-beta-curcumene cyclase